MVFFCHPDVCLIKTDFKNRFSRSVCTIVPKNSLHLLHLQIEILIQNSVVILFDLGKAG